jgi:hypothetical protein
MSGYPDYYPNNNNFPPPQRQRTFDNSPRGLPSHPKNTYNNTRGVGFNTPQRQQTQPLQRQVSPTTYNAPYPTANQYDYYEQPPESNDYYYDKAPLVGQESYNDAQYGQWNNHEVVEFNEKANKRKVSFFFFFFCSRYYHVYMFILLIFLSFSFSLFSVLVRSSCRIDKRKFDIGLSSTR